MVTLHEAFVLSSVQLLESVSGFLRKSETHCRDLGLDPEALLDAGLAPEMPNLAYHAKGCAVHSIGALEGVRSGNFSPDKTITPTNFDGLHAKIINAIDRLKALGVADVEALSDRAMTFTNDQGLRWDFLGKDFLLSFSQPNFYFHVTNAYDILRVKGVAVDKADYLGTVRMAR